MNKTKEEILKEFDEKFVRNSNLNFMPEIHKLLEKDRAELKSFLLSSIDKAVREAIDKIPNIALTCPKCDKTYKAYKKEEYLK